MTLKEKSAFPEVGSGGMERASTLVRAAAMCSFRKHLSGVDRRVCPVPQTLESADSAGQCHKGPVCPMTQMCVMILSWA